MRKIALFYATMSNPGGAEKLIVRELEYLRKNGFDAKLFTFECTDEALFGLDRKHLALIKASGILKRSIALKKSLADFKPDLIICHENVWYLYLASMTLRLPFVTHAHGSFMWHINDWRRNTLLHRRKCRRLMDGVIGHREFLSQTGSISLAERIRWELFSLLDYLAMRRSRKIFSLSRIGKSEIKELYGMDADIVFAGVDLPEDRGLPDIRGRFGLDGKRIVLTVNRLDRRKRIDVLIKAFSRVSDKRKDLALIIVGKGEEMEALKRLCKDIGISEKVIFTGFVSEAELPAYYKHCDIFVFPAWCEYGLSPIEALYFNRKVIVSEDALVVDSIRELPNVNVVRPTVQEIATEILKVLDVPSKESRGFVVEKLSWDTYFAKILGLCKGILK